MPSLQFEIPKMNKDEKTRRKIYYIKKMEGFITWTFREIRL